MRELRQDELLEYIPIKFHSQRKLYLKLKVYTLSYKTFTRDINEMIQRGLIQCQRITKPINQLKIKRIL